MTNLPEWANWVARDEDGVLYAFKSKPLQYEKGTWIPQLIDGTMEYSHIEETDDTFSPVKWTDEEPTNMKRVRESVGMLAEELNRIINAKAHGYDELPTVPDIINEPNHYKGKHGVETIDVIRNFGNDDMIAGFYWGNAIKYMTRYRSKNGLEDLKKARKNLDWLIEHTEG